MYICGRNLYNPKKLKELGFYYSNVGYSLKMNKELNYNHDISTLNGVGPKIKNTLNSIGLNDLSVIFYFPRKYNDYRN